MTEEYIKRDPGDLITAEDWNELQEKIKQDIEDKIKSAEDRIKKTGVERADNADKFDNKTPKDWTDELDKMYAPKVHDHEELAAYRRYFKKMKVNQTIVLKHDLGRLPLVDIYELCSINPTKIDQKFYLYYNHDESDKYGFFTEERGGDRRPWGSPLQQLLKECQVDWENENSLGDVVNDFWGAFFKQPDVDHMDHETSKWIDKHLEKTIAELKQQNSWPDIHLVFRPYKLIVGRKPCEQKDKVIDVVHLSYDELEIHVYTLPTGGPAREDSIDLMILLRS